MSLYCQRRVVREPCGNRQPSNQRKIPSGRVLHQSQSAPQITADRLAHIGVFVRQLPWTVTLFAYRRGLKPQLLALNVVNNETALHNQHSAPNEVSLFITGKQESSSKIAIVKVEPHLLTDPPVVAGEQISGGVLGDDSATI